MTDVPPKGAPSVNDPASDFPREDTREDFSGKQRRFKIDYRESGPGECGPGFMVTAEEVGKKGLGFEFSAFHAHSPYLALGRVREKMELRFTMLFPIEGSSHEA